MRIAIKDLKSNPFRPNLPLNDAKVKQLELNIKSTGFWDNIVARPSLDGNKYELAYGHHRLQALKNAHIKEIDIPVKVLDDGVMLQMMAQENMEDMAGSPIWAMEVVKAAYFFIKEKQGDRLLSGEELSTFLSWPYKRVWEAMANLRSTKEIPQAEEGAHEAQPHIKKEIFEALPTQKHATEFRKAVKDMGASPKVQKAVVKRFAEEPAKKHIAQELIEAKQIELGERKPPSKNKTELIGEALIYGNTLQEIVLKLPKEPPRELNEGQFATLKGLAKIIINRLRRFEE